MANTFSSLYFHLIFSTKFRKSAIDQEIESEVWDYIDGIARKNQIRPKETGGIEDHVHSLMSPPTKLSVADVAQKIKAGSSGWIKRRFEKSSFSWQDGYGAFSVSPSLVPKVIEYIKNQREHHENKTFEEEYLDLLRLHEIDIPDERFVFG